MRSYIPVLGMLFLFSLVLHAQTKIQVGLKGGINSASLIGESPTTLGGTSSTLLGATGGLTFSLPLSATMSFQAEVLYSVKGNTYRGANTGVYYADYDTAGGAQPGQKLDTSVAGRPRFGLDTAVYKSASVNLAYVEVPLLFKLALPKAVNSKIGISLFGGAYVAFLASAKIQTSLYLPSKHTFYKYESDVKFAFENQDFGIVAGTDFTFGDRLVLDLRYSSSLGSIDKTINQNYLTNQAISLTLGYKFDISL